MRCAAEQSGRNASQFRQMAVKRISVFHASRAWNVMDLQDSSSGAGQRNDERNITRFIGRVHFGQAAFDSSGVGVFEDDRAIAVERDLDHLRNRRRVRGLIQSQPCAFRFGD